MSLKTVVSEWIKKHPFLLVVCVLAFLLNLGGTWGKFQLLRDFVNGLLGKGVQMDPKTGVTTSGWLFSLLFSIFSLCVIFALLYIRSLVVIGESKGAENKRAITVRKTLEGMMLAARQIREQLIPASQQPIKVFEYVRSTYIIHKNFDTEVRRECKVRASDSPLHFWEIWVSVESEADPVDYLDEIDFKVMDNSGSGHEIKYLPTKNDSRNKRVVLYFLPRIEPSEANPRIVVISYKWPRMLARLHEVGHEVFTWHLESKKPVPLVEYAFYLEPGTGGNLECEISGPQRGALENATHTERKWPGWIYRLQDVPSDRYSLTVRLKKP